MDVAPALCLMYCFSAPLLYSNVVCTCKYLLFYVFVVVFHLLFLLLFMVCYFYVFNAVFMFLLLLFMCFFVCFLIGPVCWSMSSESESQPALSRAK